MANLQMRESLKGCGRLSMIREWSFLINPMLVEYCRVIAPSEDCLLVSYKYVTTYLIPRSFKNDFIKALDKLALTLSMLFICFLT